MATRAGRGHQASADPPGTGTKGAHVPQGAAGRRGPEVRSDLWVGVETRDDGGIELDVSSRVDSYYGQAIREQVRGLLDGFGIAHARVVIEDQGALPFVIAARVEAAVLRAGVRQSNITAVVGGASPAARSDERRVHRDRPRRSRLYLPGNEPKFMINAGLHRPDAVILDLEDSVHPDEKDAARILVRHALTAVDFHGAERMVRVNQLPRGLDDLRSIAPGQPEVILVPKVESPDQIREIDSTLDELFGGDKTRDDDDTPPWLLPILESALGIERAFEIATASPRIVALTLGLEDYAADLGVPKTADGDESLYARGRVINAARAAGVQAIDSVYGDVDDLAGLERWGAGSRALGFQGMGVLHPRQIPVIHRAFAPSATQLERAQAIVAAYEAAQAAGLGVVSLGAKMIDPPVVKQALRLVDEARALGLLDEGATP